MNDYKWLIYFIQHSQICIKSLQESIILTSSESCHNAIQKCIDNHQTQIFEWENKLKSLLNMPNKLEDMIELWVDKFKPYIDEYEDMYYILNPNAKKPAGAKSDSALFNAKNIGYLFKRTDAAYREGYTTAVITKLQYEDYNKKTPAIRLTVFYTKDEVPEDYE